MGGFSPKSNIRDRVFGGRSKNGQQASYTNAEGETTRYHYDKLNRLTLVNIDNGGNVTYAYEGYLPILQQYSGGTKRTSLYDGLSRLKGIRVTDRVNKTVLSETYQYDQANNLSYKQTTQTDTTNYHYQYDKAYRLTEERITRQGQDSTTRYRYDGVGNRLGETDQQGDTVTQTNYQYNANHELQQRAQGNATTQYQFDDNGVLTPVKNSHYLPEDYKVVWPAVRLE